MSALREWFFTLFSLTCLLKHAPQLYRMSDILEFLIASVMQINDSPNIHSIMNYYLSIIHIYMR
jgi:hypothetical protein